MKILGRVLVLVGSLLMGLAVCATEKKPPPCSTEEYRQFDFWVGQWEVFNPKGDKVGENSIKKVLSGCGLQESWVGSSGSVGQSYNIYDRTTGQWHQTWVDNSGNLLKLDGGMEDTSMVMVGLTKGKKGAVLNKITWTPEGTTVRQLWQVSTDDGENWQTVFDGLYKKKAKILNKN